ncbi:hypothetical protein HX794_07660 [Pseudomonas costantinii]|uniref:hypothetical protein n=1 Tax=Pseudomonas costantinii TaxID=168469 RepID=UPI0015A3BD08|nr:hypothetical protein [Pseudomonas costantinii]NVZ19511.1 hypothetical protein [Pseudomonas costantinii]
MDIFKKYRISTQLFIFAVSVCLIMALRYAKIDFVSNSLWAEDGAEFYPQAIGHGASSLFIPYSGYLHLFPRVIALIATLASAPMIPVIFFAGWLSSILVLYWAVRKIMIDRPHFALISFIVPLAAMLQPHSGETFLSLTNAQWWLGCTLAVIASMPWAFGHQAIPIAAALSLTGPFSILVLPVAAVQCIRHKRYAMLATIAIGAAIQISVLMDNPRESQVLDANIEHWIACLTTFFTFGTDSLQVKVASSVFWIGFLATMARPAKGSWPLIVCGVAVFVAALYSLKGMPHALSPVFNGGRYFVIPYTLIIIATFNNVRRLSAVNVITLAALASVIILSLHTIKQADTNYRGYAKFSTFEKDLRIPTAPIIENNQSYSIEVKNSKPSEGVDIGSASISPGITEIAKSICGNSRNVGYAVSLTLPRGEYVRVKWRREGRPEFKSVSRYYNAGEARVQITFVKSKKPVDLQIETTGTSSTMSTDKQVIACF